LSYFSSQDLPDSFAIMEKTKISFVRGTETEEAVPCSGYICEYNNLQVKVVMLDEIMKMHIRGVQAPSIDNITIYDNKVKKFRYIFFFFIKQIFFLVNQRYENCL
jgi:hypothetical protein